MPVITLCPEEADALNKCKLEIVQYYVWCGILALRGCKPITNVHQVPVKLSFYEYEYKDS